MKTLRCSALLVLATAALIISCSSNAASSVVTPPMVGAWQGNAKVIVIWCQHTNLNVTLNIAINGVVFGKVGDATLVDAKLTRNRGWLGRKLNIATDYLIQGKLKGPIVSAEGITRDRVFIPLNFSGTNFNGGVNTSGWEFGGKKGMKFTAAYLQLNPAH